jgi:predicted RNA-binding protein
MCQSNAYLKHNGEEKLILEEVGMIIPQNGKVLLTNIFGEEELVDGEIRLVDLIHNKVILEKA